MVIPIHVKSHYSIGCGTASVEELVAHAVNLGYPALALTDRETLAGLPRFHDLCRRSGIRPICGVELSDGPITDPHADRLVLLARDSAGYRNLCRIVSARKCELPPPTILDALRERTAGLIALSDDERMIDRLLHEHGLDARSIGYLLVRPSESPERTRSPLEIPALPNGEPVRIVADPDVLLVRPGGLAMQALLSAIQSGRTAQSLQRALWPVRLRRLRPPEELDQLFADAPDAVMETARIAEECSLDLSELGGARLAHPEAFETESAELRRRSTDALRSAREQGRYVDAVYADRAARELDTIISSGYAGYFLRAAEVVEAAREKGIMTAARGSAVGSLVLHLLGISHLDPVALGLLFERFLHPYRTTAPDIDLDVCSVRRLELAEWICSRYGREQIAIVGAYHRFQWKSALLEGTAAIRLDEARRAALTADLRHLASPPMSELDRILRRHLDDERARWIPTILRMIGAPRGLALHPSGIVIAPTPITDHSPVERGPRGFPILQYDMAGAEQVGLDKLDLHGSKALTQMAESRNLIAARGNASPDPMRPPFDDRETLQRLNRAETIGCFQVETPAMRSLLTRLDIGRIEDCVAALALVRPNAAASAAKAKQERRPPSVERLEEARSLLLYDEDLIRLLSDAGGVSLEEADALRAGILDAKGNPLVLAELERMFRTRAGKAGTDENVASTVWSLARRYSGLSVAKAQAWSYAVQAYASTYLKTHHRIEFACSLLNDYGGAYTMRTIAADLARSGVEIQGPSVNSSELRAMVAGDDRVRVGLSGIKHVTRQQAKAILSSRERGGPFRDLDDLLARVHLRYHELAALLLSGACDDLFPLSIEWYPFLHEEVLRQASTADGLIGRLAAKTRPDLPRLESPRLERYRALVRIRSELTYLGMHLFAHPMAVLRAEADALECHTAVHLNQAQAASSTPRRRLFHRFAGLIAARRRHVPSSGRTMEFLTLEDETGILESALPSGAYSALRTRVSAPGPFLFEGVLHTERADARFWIQNLRPFHDRGLM